MFGLIEESRREFPKNFLCFFRILCKSFIAVDFKCFAHVQLKYF